MIHSVLKMEMVAVPSQAGCLPAGKGLNAVASLATFVGFLQSPESSSCAHILLQPALLPRENERQQFKKRAATKICLQASNTFK